MSARDREAFGTLCVLLSRNPDLACPPASYLVAEASKLWRDARSYQRLAETACNRELTPRESSRVQSLERRITARATELGCLGVTFSGDPRGFVVKLQLPSGQSNTLGNDGWGIG